MNMTAQIGHNNPPSDLEIVAERLADKEREIRNLMSLINAPKEINDEKDAGLVTDALKGVANLTKRVSEAHEAVKKPYLECGRAADAWKKKIEAELHSIKLLYSNIMNAYLEKRAAEERARQLEAARKERERAEALAAEAAAHAEAGLDDTANELMDAAVGSEVMADRIVDKVCEATPAQLAKSRSMLGATASQKLVWTGEIENIAAIDMNALRKHFTEDAIQKAINAFVREGGRNLDGVKIWQKPVLSVR